jgi:hypothetical protein
MRASVLVLGIAATLAAPAIAAREVFAHYMMGNVYSYTQQDFTNDIAKAHASGIDGFGLNIGSTSYTDRALRTFFNAAEAFNSANGANFRSFVSFDYGAYPGWTHDQVVGNITSYSSLKSYFKLNGKPWASTFSGDSSAGDWSSIKSATNAFFIPNYQPGAGSSVADGYLSWVAWPDHTATVPNQDSNYKNTGKPYMMPVSPWFYADTYGKNWLWNTDQLWPSRWQQVYQYNPDYVELLTWNDWGESHYLGPLSQYAGAYPTGSEVYTYNPKIVHDAWLNDLPYYIAKYKNGGAEPSNYNEHVTFWYRLNPKNSCSAGGTTCNPPPQFGGDTGTYPATDCAKDQVNFTVFTTGKAVVTVTIGGTSTTVTANSPGLFTSSVPFNGNTGSVSIIVRTNGRTYSQKGPNITSDCSASANHVDWNAWVGAAP